MTPIEEFLSKEYLNNTVQSHLIALSALIFGLALIRIFKRLLLKMLRAFVLKTKTTIDDLIVDDLARYGVPILSFMVIYWSVTSLTLSTKMLRVVDVATGVAVAFFIIQLLTSTIKVIITHYVQKQENGAVKVKQVDGMMIMINIVIWTLGSILLFENLGYNVSAILTGVGIGGIAIALAAQNIVGDLFNYFVIFFDKPFEVGDAINVDDKNGTIEYIGLKTTRLRSVSGEQIIISNSDLTKSRVHNFKRQENRRVEFSISVVHDTPIEKLEEIPGMIKAIIEETPNTRFDRAHFSKFTDYGLVFSVVYNVTVPDYLKYMDNQQRINLKIIAAFQREGIEFLVRESSKSNDTPTPKST